MKPVVRQDFSIFAAGVTYCVALVAALCAQFVLVPFLDNETLSLAYSFVGPTIYVLVVFGLGRILGVDVPKATGLMRRPPVKPALWVLPLAIACVLAFMPLAMGVQYLFSLMGYHATPNYMDYRSSWQKMLIALVAMAVMPALGEECLLRGCVFSALKNRGTYRGILATALLFALMHASPVQFIHQFLIGVVMCYLVYMTETVWTSVIFHFCNNAIVIIYDFACEQAGASFEIPWWVYLVLFVVFAPVVVTLLYAFGVSCRRAKEKARDAQEAGGVASISFAFDAQREAKLPCKERVRRFLDYNGKFLSYNTAEPFTPMLVVFVLTGLIWVINTVSGWLQ